MRKFKFTQKRIKLHFVVQHLLGWTCFIDIRSRENKTFSLDKMYMIFISFPAFFSIQVAKHGYGFLVRYTGKKIFNHFDFFRHISLLTRLSCAPVQGTGRRETLGTKLTCKRVYTDLWDLISEAQNGFIAMNPFVTGIKT